MIDYNSVVPWGRSFQEYRAMFNLRDRELKGSILGCGDGPAAFNAELTSRGGRVVSLDPLYGFSKEQIKNRIEETFQDVLTQTRENRDKFRWETIASPEELGRMRMTAMEIFLADYDLGKSQGRYIPGALPEIPVEETFDLALSSHFLFLYSRLLDLEFHIEAVEAMLGKAKELRVFPLLDLNGGISPHVDALTEHCRNRGYRVEILEVKYEFQLGGNQMLRVYRPV